MARTKEFDPDVALDTAMRLFWRRGYEGTSTADLVEATGVARASLYATFGTKRELYVACLDHYLGGGAGDTAEETAASADTGLDAVAALLRHGAGLAVSDVPDGCFSVNATVEHATTDPEIVRRLETNRQRLESALHGALLRARREGQVRRDLDPAATARLLLSTITGVLVLGRAGAAQRDRIDDTVRAALHLIAP